MKAKDVVKLVLKKNNISVNKLARAIGVSQQNIERRLSERVNSDISTPALTQIANYLDYDLVLLPKSKNGGGGIIIDGKDEQ